MSQSATTLGPGNARDTYDFVLYVAGDSPNSARAKLNLQRLCETHLAGRHAIAVVDVLANPMGAVTNGVFATPTLVKRGPGAVRSILGDLSKTSDLLAVLELPASTNSPSAP